MPNGYIYDAREYGDMVMCLGQAGGNSLRALRIYKEKFPNRRHPSSSSIITAAFQRLLENRPIAHVPVGSRRERKAKNVNRAATQSTDVNVQDVPGSSTSALDPLAISKPTHETDEGNDRLVIKMENEEDNFQPISERFTTTAGASSQHQTATAHSFRRSSSYASYAPTPLVMDLNEPSRSETADIKPVINSWLALNATSSPMLEVNPLSLHNEDSSSSNAFRADENSSFFQFFRAIHSEFQELSAKRQRQFKKKCLDYLHELMDEQENDHQHGYFHQDNMNLSNSFHMNEEERDVKPVVKDGCVLSSN